MVPEKLNKDYRIWEKNVLKFLDIYEHQDNLVQLLNFLNYQKNVEKLDILEEGEKFQKSFY